MHTHFPITINGTCLEVPRSKVLLLNPAGLTEKIVKIFQEQGLDMIPADVLADGVHKQIAVYYEMPDEDFNFLLQQKRDWVTRIITSAGHSKDLADAFIDDNCYVDCIHTKHVPEFVRQDFTAWNEPANAHHVTFYTKQPDGTFDDVPAETQVLSDYSLGAAQHAAAAKCASHGFAGYSIHSAPPECKNLTGLVEI